MNPNVWTGVRAPSFKVDPSLFGNAVSLLLAIKRRDKEAQLRHLHGLSGGRRSRGLDLGGIDGLPFRGPSPRLVFLERVGPRLNALQSASIADVHLLWSHLLAAGPLEA